MEIVKGRSPDQWDEMVKRLDGCPFHSSLWSRYSAAANNTEPIYFIKRGQAGDVAAMAIGYVKQEKLGPVPIYKCLSFGSLPAAAGDMEREAMLESLSRYAAEAKFATLSLHSFGTPVGSPFLEKNRFVLSKRWEFIVDLEISEDDLWKKLHGKKRNLIRKAQKSGVEIARGKTFDDMQAYRQLAVETRERKCSRGIPFPETGDEARYQRMHNKLIEPGLAELYLAKSDGRAIAGAVFVNGFDKAYYMLSSAGEEGLRKSAPDLIIWTAMTDCIRKGCRLFNLGGVSEADLGGAPFEKSGLYHFKKRFSADANPCFKGTTILRPTAYKTYNYIKKIKSVIAN